jgi:hypothetical protein
MEKQFLLLREIKREAESLAGWTEHGNIRLSKDMRFRMEVSSYKDLDRPVCREVWHICLSRTLFHLEVEGRIEVKSKAAQ